MDNLRTGPKLRYFKKLFFYIFLYFFKNLSNRNVFASFFSFIIMFYSFDKFFKSSQWQTFQNYVNYKEVFFNHYKEVFYGYKDVFLLI